MDLTWLAAQSVAAFLSVFTWHLSWARHLVLPYRGHNDTDPCVNWMIEAFMITGNLAGLDRSCLAKTDDPSFALQRDELAK